MSSSFHFKLYLPISATKQNMVRMKLMISCQFFKTVLLTFFALNVVFFAFFSYTPKTSMILFLCFPFFLCQSIRSVTYITNCNNTRFESFAAPALAIAFKNILFVKIIPIFMNVIKSSSPLCSCTIKCDNSRWQ